MQLVHRGVLGQPVRKCIRASSVTEGRGRESAVLARGMSLMTGRMSWKGKNSRKTLPCSKATSGSA